MASHTATKTGGMSSFTRQVNTTTLCSFIILIICNLQRCSNAPECRKLHLHRSNFSSGSYHQIIRSLLDPQMVFLTSCLSHLVLCHSRQNYGHLFHVKEPKHIHTALATVQRVARRNGTSSRKEKRV